MRTSIIDDKNYKTRLIIFILLKGTPKGTKNKKNTVQYTK